MNRRELLKLLGASGLVIANPLALTSSSASAACAESELWLTVAARGGWDPASLFDPKGEVDITGSGPVNHFTTAEIRNYGNIGVSPYIIDPSNDRFANFFSQYASEILVINGIETSTNNHLTGEKHMWTGRIDDYYPCFAACVAGSSDTTIPLAFLSSGYYDRTGGLVAKSLLSADPTSLLEIAQPNKVYPLDSSRDQQTYFDDTIFNTVQNAQQARLDRLIAKEVLPKRKRSMEMLRNARIGRSQLSQLISRLPATLDDSANPFIKQAEVCCAAFSAGLATTANLEIGEFDSHVDHDNMHYENAARLLETVDFIIQEAERQGIRERLNIVIGSDFGRTPWYNSKGGKDHWSSTGMIAMGPSIRGNRVIGATDDAMMAQKINPSSLAIDPDGILITPGLLNYQLRQLACVSNDIIDKFPLQLTAAELAASPIFS